MKYLAFGMNTNLNGMSHRCPTATVLGPAILPDYKLKFRLHADIEHRVGSEVVGVLWEISEHDLEELDQLEGYPTYYTRKFVEVWHNDQWIDAVVYMMTDQKYEREPDRGYLDCCIEGYTSNNISIDQLEEAYYSSIYTNQYK